MKRILHIILLLLVTITTFAQTFKVRECTEGEIPLNRRPKYYDEAHRVVQDFYMLLLESVGNTDNRDVVIEQLINDKQATTLKTDFLLTQDQNLSYCSSLQYFTKFEAVYKDMAEEVEFLVDNFSDSKIMMNSLVSCYIPVEYDLTLMKGEEILFKRRCSMYCLFPKVSADKLVKVMQVEPVRDIIAYKKPETLTVVADNNQTTDMVHVSGVKTKYPSFSDIRKSFIEGERFEQIKAKAEQGDINAQYELGNLYSLGSKRHEAFEWYSKAAEQGHYKAQNELGECYEKGWGVNKDEKIAFEYYTKASKFYEPAQIETALCYYYGKGITKSYKDAYKIFDKVIHKEYDRKNPYHQKAAYFIGLMYEYGQGMDVDLYKAVINYEKCGLYEDAPDRIKYINSINEKVRESFYKKNLNKGNNIAIGIVMSRENNQDIYHNGAMVSNLNTGEFVHTDKEGKFQLNKLKEGDIICFYRNGHNIHYLEWGKEWKSGDLYIILGKANEHIVKDGETIEQICSQYGISIHQLINHNIKLLIEKDIKVGQKLYIPYKKYLAE